MSDIVQRVELLIGGNATQAKKVIAEVEQMTKQAKVRSLANQEKDGRAAAEQYGRAFNRAQDRWLNTAEQGFRRWGGTVGGILADVLSVFDKVDKISIASERAARIEARAGGSGATVATTAVAAAAGAGIASTPKGIALSKNLQPNYNPAGKSFLRRLQDRGKYAILDNAASKLSIADQDLYWQVFEPGGRSKMSADDFKRRDQLLKNDPNLDNRSLSNRRKTLAGIRTYGGDLSGVKKYVGGNVGLGVGALVSGVAIAANSVKMLSDKFDEIKQKQDKFSKNQETIDSIEKMGNSLDKTRAILAAFGKDGQKAFRMLKEEQAGLADDLSKLDRWNELAKQGNTTWGELKTVASDTFDDIKFKYSSMMQTFVDAGAILSDQFVTPELQASVDQSGKDAAAAQAKLDAKLAKRVTRADELAKIEAESVKLNEQLANTEEDTDEKKKKSLELDIKINQEWMDMLDSQKDKNEYLDAENAKKKATIELNKLELSMAEKKKKLQEELVDMIDDENRSIAAKEKSIEDRSRYSISELAGTNSGAGNAATRVQNLEARAKEMRLTGNHAGAEALLNQANAIRGQLGAAGITTSSEFGADFKVAGPVKPLTVAERQFNALAMQQGILKYGDRAGGPIYAELKKKANERLAQMQSGRGDKVSIDRILQDYASNGGFIVKPKNGK